MKTKEIINIKKDGIDKLKEILNNYEYGVVGGYLEDELDKYADTISRITDYLNGEDIEILRHSYPPFRVYRLLKVFTN